MADDYVCTLDAAAVKKAVDELNELPSDRLAAVQSLRQWVQQQPHIKCPTDTYFLIPFLRARKFSQLEARVLLEKHIEIRTSMPDRFYNLDPCDSVSKKMLLRGAFVILPKRDKEGRMVIISKAGKSDPTFKAYSKLDEFRTRTMFMDILYILDELNQVNGVVTIIDLTGSTLKHQRALSMDEHKTNMKIFTGGYPARMKGLHMYNVGAMMEFLSMMMKVVMSDTIKERLHIHASLESLYKHIPMEVLPDEYLPDEYEGPTGGTWEDAMKYTEDYITNKGIVERVKHISSDQWRVDASKKPKLAKSESQTSFRKLNID